MAKTPRSKGSSLRKEETTAFTDPGEIPEAAAPKETDADDWSLDDDVPTRETRVVGEESLSIPESRAPQPEAAEEEKPADRVTSDSFESNPSRETVVKAEDLPVRASARMEPKPAVSEDPFEMGGEELPVLERKPEAEKPSPPEPEISEYERNDFIEAEKAPEPAVRKERPAWERLTLMGACAATILTGGAIVWTLLASGPPAQAAPSNPSPSLPMKGASATVTAADVYWRARRATDRVSGIEVSLPTPDLMESTIVPEVKLTLDPGSSQNGFVKVSFINSEGDIAGDVRILKVTSGKFETMDRGETVISPSEASVYGSVGFTDRLNYLHYTSGDAPRWYVEVRESADYNAGESGWKKMDAFDIPNAMRD